ncbi:hypothetical protein [Mycobacterium malmoense]|uniref:hypothetical protein n=1 Tax=Mycobacterium malmoense TaxID=1780 RepID=UPI0008F8CDA3|nr:hypothetical protein [Mycobacterium malmoense]OIN79979.1 hypothetical protein BMG05_14970 [Mycobacterium malmoense]
MTTAISVHRCLAGADCRRAEHADNQRRGAPTEKPNTLCPPCLTHISSAIRQLPDDWAELRQALGERATNTGQRVHSTPTPAIPISTRKEAIMAAIVETSERAAIVVSEALHTDPPDPRRKPPPTIITEQMQRLLRLPEDLAGKPTAPLPGTPASGAAENVHPTNEQILTAAIRLVEPNIDRLVIAPAETHNVWAKFGENRELIELSGIEIALALVELHNQARAELGLTKLRHRYRYPCPDCGGRIYRNDGESIVYCENDPKHTRTEREYKLVAGQLMTERGYMQLREYYLAEGYWRLDRVQELVDNMRDDPRIDLAGAGTIILEQLTAILTEGALDKDNKPIPHQTPQQRATGTDRKSAIERQVDEDNWTWRNEKPYEKPNRKRRKATKPVDSPIHPGSLTTLVDIDESVASCGPKCPECNLVHSGECA